jgi:hypothetical protein
MEQECIDLTEQIERCRRLAQELTDDEMRHALEALAKAYEARLKRPANGSFMLRNRS